MVKILSPWLTLVASFLETPHIQSCPATTRLVITLIGCNAVGRASFFFFFLTANCFIFYVLCHDVLLPLTMSIVYLFVSVLLLYVGK